MKKGKAMPSSNELRTYLLQRSIVSLPLLIVFGVLVHLSPDSAFGTSQAEHLLPGHDRRRGALAPGDEQHGRDKSHAQRLLLR